MQYQATERAAGDQTGLHHDLTNQIRYIVETARSEGIDPSSDQAAAVVDDLLDRYARCFGKADTPSYRSDVLARLNTANDPRAERYWQLIATINGWPVPSTLTPVFHWFIEALQHHPNPSTSRA